MALQPQEIGKIAQNLQETLSNITVSITETFFANMPPAYFRDTDHQTQNRHLQHIIALKAANAPHAMTLRNGDDTVLTFLDTRERPGRLLECLNQLPTNQSLWSARLYSSRDNSLALSFFQFSPPARFNAEDPVHCQRREQILESASPPDEEAWSGFSRFIDQCPAPYLFSNNPEDIAVHWHLCNQVMVSDGAETTLTPEAGNPGFYHITLVVGNAIPRYLLERLAARLAAAELDLHMATLDVRTSPTGGNVTFLRFVVRGLDHRSPQRQSRLTELLRDMRRTKWLDNRTLRLADRYPGFSLTEAEVLTALCDLVHQRLTKMDPYAYSRDRVLKLAEENLNLVRDLVSLFCQRFNPSNPCSEARFKERLEALRATINAVVEARETRNVLRSLIDAVAATRRTNVQLSERYALALRLDPAFFQHETRPHIPFGVYFVHGRSFTGFHLRFQDIARGGVRVVRPPNANHHTLETERLFDEVYDLAAAQQLKNKDIPEGGAKAVLLLEPLANTDRAVRAFGDALLDLTVPNSPPLQPAVDRLAHLELLYLGPDENISDHLIRWLVARAGHRGYPLPEAFMSSKPETGINHKSFGVTSEGLNVFLEIALCEVGINPRTTPFTIKMTGGPDGDVAGNEIRILHREFGDNARILGIADGSGSAEDPQGLDHEELLHLVKTGQPIRAFNPQRLSPQGHIAPLDTPDGQVRRNTLHNRLVTDAFLPCGGRPGTISASNWRQFMTREGKPSARVVVEGANLFLTEEARRQLSRNSDLLIIKDSSANKAGVICSSFEIAASMVLSQKAFLNIKARFVAEILEKLRSLARVEAQLLFKEKRRRPREILPDLSVRISNSINRVADAIEPILKDLDPKDRALTRSLVCDHFPESLGVRTTAHLLDRLPVPYLKRAMASTLAARIVYHEGIDFLETLDTVEAGRTAINYLRQEKAIASLVDELEGSSLPNRETMINLLKKGGTRTALMHNPLPRGSG